MLAAFDPAHPGRGRDGYSEADLDHAMAYGVFCSAVSNLGNEKAAAVAAEWLLRNANRHDEVMGWGLPFEWRAFRKEKANPIHTVYTITSVEVVSGLLDYFQLSRDRRVLDAVIECLDYLGRLTVEAESGQFVKYSDQEGDEYEVHNVCAMLMAQFARVYAITLDQHYARNAHELFRRLMYSRQSESNMHFWNYGSYTERPNDLVHAAYVVHGLHVYRRRFNAEIDLSQALDYLESFVVDGEVREFHPHETLMVKERTRPARLWGVGMLIAVLADAGRLGRAKDVARTLRAYAFSPGRYSDVAGGSAWTPRMQAYALLGLARLERAARRRTDR